MVVKGEAMIPALLLRAFGLSLPAPIARFADWIALALVVALGWAIWLHHHDTVLIEAHEAAISTAVASATDAANQAASNTANTEQAQVEASNDQARRAAIGSDDPLRAVDDSLRAGSPAHRHATR
jgi:hypothetical protein